MTEQKLDELGPADFLVIEFPAGQANFTCDLDALVGLEAQLANAMEPGSAAVTPGRRRSP